MKTFAIGVVALMALVFAAFAVKPEQVPVTQPETEPETKQVEPEPKAEKSIEEKFVYIQMKTSKGEIFIELNNELAPISTANFVRYAEEGFYNETIFHRVISNFMIQGGGFDKDMKQKKPHEGIENEWKNGLSNKRGTIAMARLGGQANSGTSQFFINVADNGFLDQPRDGSGRELTPDTGGVVPPDTLFLFSTFRGSYDSRYFGPIPAAGVLGLAKPVFTFTP